MFLGSEMLYTRSIVTMSRLLEIFQAAMRDVNPPLGAAPPLPYDPVPHVAPPQTNSPSNGDGRPGCSKNVLIISLAILLFGVWMKVGNTWHYYCPHLGL